jgi:membrane protein
VKIKTRKLVVAEEPKNSEGDHSQPLTLGGAALNAATVSAPRAALSVLERTCWLGRVFISSASRFYWDDGFSRAASLAYTSLLSLVPLTVVAFGLLASFATSTEYIGRAREFIFKQFVPDNQFVSDVLVYIENFSAAASQFNVTFVLFLVVTALLLVNSIEYALNATWQVFEPRPWSQRLAVFSAILLVAPPLILSGYYFYEKFSHSEFLADAGVMSNFSRALLPYFFDWIAFLALYFLVPKAPVRFWNACFGGLVAAILFNLAKAGFALYLRDFASYSTLYKSIAAVPVSLVWLYLSWIILLFGAEISYQCQYLPRVGNLFKQSVLSVGDARMMLAIQSLVLIESAFSKGRELPSDIELAEKLGCSTVVLKPTIDALERAGIVTRGDSREMPITLLKSAEQISIAEVREALYGAQVALHYPKAMARLFTSLAEGQGLSEITLAQLVAESPKSERLERGH